MTGLGEVVVEKLFVALILGDWKGALKFINTLQIVDACDLQDALENTDADGNTLMHRALMDGEALLVDEQPSIQKERTGRIKFAILDHDHQFMTEKIIGKLFELDEMLLSRVNGAELLPQDCCSSKFFKDYIRMLARRKYLRDLTKQNSRKTFKSRSNIAKHSKDHLAEDQGGNSGHGTPGVESDTVTLSSSAAIPKQCPSGLKLVLEWRKMISTLFRSSLPLQFCPPFNTFE